MRGGATGPSCLLESGNDALRRLLGGVGLEGWNQPRAFQEVNMNLQKSWPLLAPGDGQLKEVKADEPTATRWRVQQAGNRQVVFLLILAEPHCLYKISDFLLFKGSIIIDFRERDLILN